ncbi:MAG TPA: Arc family DNA-binding protein [Propionibacteriaceae bacterium]|jgi:plasmid stability protein
MSMLTVRDLNPEVKEKLRQRAARHGRSMEAEVRLILAAAVEAGDEPLDLVASIRKHFSGSGIELELPDRTSTTQRPITFGS